MSARHPMPSTEEAFKTAVAHLRGREANLWINVVILAIVGIYALVGYTVMTEDKPTERLMTYITVICLTSLAFAVARIAQSRKEAALANSAGSRAIMPSFVEYVLMVFLLLNGLVLAFWSFALVPWFGFAAVISIWLIASCFALMQIDRDRRDAEAWEATAQKERESQLRHVLRACSGAWEFRVVTWSAFILAVFSAFVWIWIDWCSSSLVTTALSLCSDLQFSRKVLFTCALWFNVVFIQYAEKWLRDKVGTEIMTYDVLMAVSLIIVLFGPPIAVFSISTTLEQRYDLVLGFMMTAGTTWNLARLLRNMYAVKALLEELPAEHGSMIEVVPGAEAAERRTREALKEGKVRLPDFSLKKIMDGTSTNAGGSQGQGAQTPTADPPEILPAWRKRVVPPASWGYDQTYDGAGVHAVLALGPQPRRVVPPALWGHDQAYAGMGAHAGVGTC